MIRYQLFQHVPISSLIQQVIMCRRKQKQWIASLCGAVSQHVNVCQGTEVMFLYRIGMTD